MRHPSAEQRQFAVVPARAARRRRRDPPAVARAGRAATTRPGLALWRGSPGWASTALAGAGALGGLGDPSWPDLSWSRPRNSAVTPCPGRWSSRPPRCFPRCCRARRCRPGARWLPGLAAGGPLATLAAAAVAAPRGGRRRRRRWYCSPSGDAVRRRPRRAPDRRWTRPGGCSQVRADELLAQGSARPTRRPRFDAGRAGLSRRSCSARASALLERQRRLREAAAAVRPADRPLPGRQASARRRGDRPRAGPAAARRSARRWSRTDRRRATSRRPRSPAPTRRTGPRGPPCRCTARSATPRSTTCSCG